MSRWQLSLCVIALLIGVCVGYLHYHSEDWDEPSPVAPRITPTPRPTDAPVSMKRENVEPASKKATPESSGVGAALERGGTARENFVRDREALRGQQTALLATTYGPLLDALQLPGDTRGALLELLADQRMVGLETEIQSAVGATSDFSASVTEALATNQILVEQLVGRDRAQTIKDYEVGIARTKMAQEAITAVQSTNVALPGNKALTSALAGFDPGVQLNTRLANRTPITTQEAEAAITDGKAAMTAIVARSELNLTPIQRTALIDWAGKRVQAQINWANAVLEMGK